MNYSIINFTDLGYSVITPVEGKIIIICLLIGFGVKMPIWPFYG